MNDRRQFATIVPEVMRLAEEAGVYLLRVQREVTREEKAPGDLVSEADRTAERMLRDGLARIFPEALFRGEESTWSAWPADAYAWVVDPLDGTKPYLDGEDGWGISIALLHGDRPVLGVIYLPNRRMRYAAARGNGATRDDVPIAIEQAPLAGSAIAGSASKLETLKERGVAAALPRARFLPQYASVMNSAAVIDGEAAAYVSLKKNTKAWDLAAACLIVEEAGGKATLLNGRPIGFNKEDPLLPTTVLSNGAVHEELLRVLKDAGLE